MEIHLKKHIPSCKICGLFFNTTRSLKIHIEIHKKIWSESLERNSYLCHICKLEFAMPDAIKNHLFDAHPKSIFKCSICDANFGTKQAKVFHMYEGHNVNLFGKVCFWCNICGVGYRSNSKLMIHKWKKHGEKIGKNKTYETKMTPSGVSKNVILKVKPPLFGRLAHGGSGLQECCRQGSTGTLFSVVYIVK